jgi:hypothetical protein
MSRRHHELPPATTVASSAESRKPGQAQTELDHGLRLRLHSPREGALYPSYAKFITTPDLWTGLPKRLCMEDHRLDTDAVDHGYHREGERHSASATAFAISSTNSVSPTGIRPRNRICWPTDTSTSTRQR